MNKLKKKKVLIVDDEERNTFALKSYLETFEMIIIEARNGEDAIQILKRETDVAIILLDMMMPVMDGYETLSFLKANDLLKRIPVIAVTARAMKGDKEKCIESGAWDYVSKPIDLASLMDIINKWIL